MWSVLSTPRVNSLSPLLSHGQLLSCGQSSLVVWSIFSCGVVSILLWSPVFSGCGSHPGQYFPSESFYSTTCLEFFVHLIQLSLACKINLVCGL